MADPPTNTVRQAIAGAFSGACCGDCPRAAPDRAARLALDAMGRVMPMPAMQRALMGMAPDSVLTGQQSAEAISRFRAMLQAAAE